MRKQSSRRTAPRPSRSGSLLTVAGIGIVGYALYAVLNKTHAATAVLPSTGTGPGYGGGPAGYTPAALNASVPGVTFAPSVLQPGILTSTLTGVPAVTGAQVSAANSFWSTLQPVAAIDTGYITFPSGSQVAASLMGGGNTAMDGNGNYYVQWAGRVYQLGSQDSSGNWPAALVGGD